MLWYKYRVQIKLLISSILIGLAITFVATAVETGIHQKNYNEYNNWKPIYNFVKANNTNGNRGSSEIFDASHISFKEYIKTANENTKTYQSIVTINQIYVTDKAYFNQTQIKSVLDYEGWKSFDDLTGFTDLASSLKFVKADQAVYNTCLAFMIISLLLIGGICIPIIYKFRKDL